MKWILAIVCAAVWFANGYLIAAYAHSSLQEHANLGDDGFVGGDLAGDTAAVASIDVPSQFGCRNNFITTNFSSRGGEAPRLLVLHYTVSTNRPGEDDVFAIRNFFNSPPSDVSSNYVIDFEGHCQYIVNESAKAWTQLFFNPFSVSIEFIANGHETKEQWLTDGLPGLKKGARVFADAAKRYGIPLEYVNPVGCEVPKGITDHERLECGNSHTDVQPNFPYGRFLELAKEFAAPKVRFVLMDGEGHQLAQSTAVRSGGEAERDRYRAFVLNRLGLQLRELRADRDFVVRRVKVQ